MRVLDHDDGRVDHRADGNRNAAERHDGRVDAERVHGDEGHQHADGQHDDRDQGTPDVQQEDDADEGDDDAFLDQRALQRVDGPQDQLRAVVDRLDAHVLGQARGDLGDLLLDVVDDLEGVFAVALDGDAADHLALAVQLGEAAPFVRPQLDAGDVAEQHRRQPLGFQHHLLEVAGPAQVAAAPNHVLGLGHFDDPAAHVHVAGADGIDDVGERDPVALQPQGIDGDGVGLDEAADAGDLRDPLRLGQREADGPVLQGTQLGERPLGAHDDVLVDPADAGGIRPQRWRDAGRQPAGGEVEVFEDARARPVEVGAVLEDDVDERDAEHRKAAHHLRVRHGQHGRGQREGDLVLHDLRCLARILGVDDHLDVGEVGDGVHRRLDHRVDAGGDDEDGGEQDQEEVVGRPADDGGDHWC